MIWCVKDCKGLIQILKLLNEHLSYIRASAVTMAAVKFLPEEQEHKGHANQEVDNGYYAPPAHEVCRLVSSR
jgi:hypothetical protein